MKAFMKLMRSEALMSLISKPYALTLLTVIAMRAKRVDDDSSDELELGQAYIGDYRNYGMTEATYRTAKEQLTKRGLIATKATNKGTIATLTNTKVFDINIVDDNEQNNGQATGKQRANHERVNGQITTNKNKELKNKEYLPPNPQGGTDINLGIDPSPLPIEIQNQEGMGGGGEVHPLRKWIAKDLPNVSKMKTQLTNQNCEDLIEEFGKKIIQNVLEAMENVNGIQKKYTSVNLTVRNWAKKRIEDHPELKPKPQPVEMPNWFPQADE
jgi:hypothetical protein